MLLKTTTLGVSFAILAFLSVIKSERPFSEQNQTLPRASIDSTGPGWRALGEQDFVDVNCDPDTWVWKDDLLVCSGLPVGVLRTRQMVTNFELVVEWRHLRAAGNSGVFVWVSEESLKELKRDALPQSGIEVQMLDHGYTELYERRSGRKADWFTTNGDVFGVGKTVFRPFPPLSPNGSRSFPRKRLSKGFGEWNHYYVRAINGELRLWVNGEEVSGGNDAEPRTGYLCMESEGSPIEFRNIRLREVR